MKSARKGIDWNSQPLGAVSDCALARELGVDPESVRSARLKRGIGPYATRDAGKRFFRVNGEPVTYIDLIDLMGISKSGVRQRLKGVENGAEIGSMLRVDWSKRPAGIDWDAQPLGKVTDVRLAHTLGVSESSVLAARRKRKIPACADKRRSSERVYSVSGVELYFDDLRRIAGTSRSGMFARLRGVKSGEELAPTILRPMLVNARRK